MREVLPFGPDTGDSVVAILLWQPERAGSGVFYRKPGQYVRVSKGEVMQSWRLTSCFVLDSPNPIDQPLLYRGLSISQGSCETRLVATREKGLWKGYLLSVTHGRGILYVAIGFQCSFRGSFFDGRIQAGRLPSWPSDESTAKKRFQGSLNMEEQVDETRPIKFGPGPTLRKVWVFEDESLELVLTLFNEAHGQGSQSENDSTLSKLSSKLLVSFREFRK